LSKTSGVGDVAWRLGIGGGQVLDGYECLDQRSRKLQGTLQNLGKDIGVMIRNWIGKTVFWEEVGKMFEEPDEEVTTGMAEDCRIGE
jgi:hypothetical protein